MCSIDITPPFLDTVFGTRNQRELLSVVSRLSREELMKYKLAQLKEIGMNLRLSGIKSALTKGKVYDKISVAVLTATPDREYEIPELTYLLFDTETTLGFGTGRLLQLSFSVYRGTEPLFTYDSYVFPCGFKVTGTDIHGIDEELAYSEGRPIKEVLNAFVSAINRYQVDVLVAHNFPFDRDVLQRESITADMKLFTDDDGPGVISRQLRYLDTCRTSSILTFVQLSEGTNRATFPSLELLYQVCTGTKREITHNAVDDVDVLSICLFSLLRRGIVTEETMKVLTLSSV